MTNNVLTSAYAMDGKAKPKKPRKRKNVDIDDQLILVDPASPVDPAVALKGKRKKKIPLCPNPLFLGWLEEWKAEAKARDNTNLCYVYGKAIKSLKKYPAVMESGQACAILENLGPKTCKMLDERLAEHRIWLAENGDENGSSSPMGVDNGFSTISGAHNGVGRNPSSTSLTSSSSSSIGLSTHNPPSTSAALPSHRSSSTTPSSQLPSTSAPAAKKPRRDPSTPRRQREYTPVLRSGAYALLITLLRALPHRIYLTKKQLMQEAQPLSDTSFQKPDDPDSFYSAWSSMKTLLTKELVKKESNPAKFSLTEAGAALAGKLEDADGSFFLAESESSQVSRTSVTGNSTVSGMTSAVMANGTSHLASSNDGSTSGPRQYVAAGSKSYVAAGSNSSVAGVSKSSVAASSKSAAARKIHNISLISSDEDDVIPPPLSQVITNGKSKGKATSGMKTKRSIPSPDLPSLPSGICQTSTEFQQPSSYSSGYVPHSTAFSSQLPSSSRPPITSLSSSSPFPFIYLDYDHIEIKDKDSAAVTFDSIVGVGFLVKCRRKDLAVSGKRFSPFQDDARRRSLSGGCGGVEDFVMAYLSNDDCSEGAPGLGTVVSDSSRDSPAVVESKDSHSASADIGSEKKSEDSFQSPTLLGVKKKRKKKRKSDVRSVNISFDDVLGDSDEDFPTVPTSAAVNGQKSDALPTSKGVPVTDTVPLRNLPAQKPIRPEASLPPVSSPITLADSPAMTRVKGHQRRRSVQDVLSTMVASPRSKRTSIVPPLFTLRPGSFQVFLIVDTSEVAGGPSKASGMRKDAVVPELDRNGVSYFTRRLAVGDFVWIARENCSPHREIVLDFIIERKRMDDLASSICDGRFREQKHRMKQSGLGHVIYLIEEYGARLTFGNMPDASLRQAISNVQIIDDFHVVNCKDPKAVIGYLSLMTQYLRSLYAGKTLHAVPHATFTSGAKLTLDDAVQHLITFDEFGRVAEKNKDLTSRELFSKHLVVLAGVSADRAFAIVEKYPTPEMMMRAYDKLGTVKEKEDLLKDLKCGLSRRKLGPTISKMFSQLYSQRGPLK